LFLLLGKIIEKSYERINGRILLLALCIFSLFLFLVLPGEAQRSQHYFGGSPTPDTSFVYSDDDLYQMARDFGQQGRAYYIRSRFTFDVFWPMAYGFFPVGSHCLFWKTLSEECLSVCPGTPFYGSRLGCARKHGCLLGDVGLPETNSLAVVGGSLFHLKQMAGH